MSRPLRIEFHGAYYHLMNRGLARQEIFTDRYDREAFLKLVEESHQMWRLRVIAYCLMDNHYHLLVQTPEPNLSRIMRHLDGVYTQQYNRRHRRDGPLFRGRYRAIIVDADEYLLAVARYIHRNPVAAGLTKLPEHHEWSSCRHYLEEKRPAWLDVDQLLSRFPEKETKAAFLTFMRSEVEAPVKSFYERAQWLPVLGSSRFIERLKRWIGKKQISTQEVPQAKAYVQPSLKACLQAVMRVYGKSEAEIKRSRRGERNEARAIAIYVCRRLAGMREGEIAAAFGVSGYSAVSSAVGRMQGEIEKGGEIVSRYRRIQQLLQR